MKKFSFILFLLLLSVAVCFGSDYSLSIKNADMVRVKGSFILLSGNINIDFSTEEGDKYKLSAQKVVLDTDNNNIDASGSVVLTKGDGSESFKGEVVTLNWKKLDIKVFDGTSRSERKNASKNTVNFYSQGASISYAGAGDTVLFENGVVSTKDKNTNWSIDAKQIELLGNDLFFRNATLKIGRVPIFWFPVFYYPGSKLGFNPSVGVTTRKVSTSTETKTTDVSFINTTTEIYGTYSMSSSSSSVQDSDTDAITENVLSLLQKNDNTVLVRDGLLYKEYDKDEPLPPLQAWAKRTGSYFAFFADAYSDRGVAVGYDTKNNFKSNKITLTSKGIMAFDPRENKGENIRFANDLTLSARIKSLSLSMTIPYISDPDVKKDYYNRINNFAIDSIFGTKQTIPTSFSSSITSYIMNFNASWSKTVGKFSFSLSSLRGMITFKQKYKLDENNKAVALDEYEIYTMSLPTLTFSSSGTLFELKGKDNSKTVPKDYNNKTAKEFEEEINTLEEGSESKPADMITAPDVDLTKTTSLTGAQLKMSYNLSYSLDNYYSQKSETAYTEDVDYNESLTSKLSGNLILNGKAPGNWLNFTDTLKPSYDFTIATDESKTHYTALTNSLSAYSSELGLSYSLSQKLYTNKTVISKDLEKTTTEFKGKFDEDSVTAHSLSFSKKLGSFSLGLSTTLKPVTETISPNVSYSKSGFSFSSNLSMKRADEEEEFKKNTSNINFSYSNNYLSTYMYNSYDFTKTDDEIKWEGLKTNAKIQLTIPKPSFNIYGIVSTQEKFEPQSLETGLNFIGNTAVIKFVNDEDYKLKKDSLTVNLKYSFPSEYFWKNRIGLNSSMSTSFNYDFDNEYAASFSFIFNLGFSINKFIDMDLSIKSTNNSFYNYYETIDGKPTFQVNEVFKDLLRSFDIFTGGNRKTNFNINTFTLSLVHYMEDWNLYVDGTGGIMNDGSQYYFDTSYTVYVKWNIIPEIKTENSFHTDGGWEK